MMNLAMNTEMKGMQEKAENLIPKEMQDKNDAQKGENSLKEPNIEVNNKGKPIQQKKKEKKSYFR